ncbi:hypothetical protein EVAR_70626_1 [Eumeta japonica]|uniref:Uncharacterized protein n=1 Tax=Eumeta variegata TaxID=151549 RepID=A0A4C2A9J9_EUMVA|nr:hypothetical protein EVAR_70626_1 [Eumeta japonica]
MCRWELAYVWFRSTIRNDCIICSSPSWWYFDETLEDAAERLRMKRKDYLFWRHVPLGSWLMYGSGQQYENDCIICSSPSWWYFDETLEDAAERLRMKRKVNKNLA